VEVLLHLVDPIHLASLPSVELAQANFRKLSGPLRLAADGRRHF
jgi:hypothetical protein